MAVGRGAVDMDGCGTCGSGGLGRASRIVDDKGVPGVIVKPCKEPFSEPVDSE